MIETTPAVVYSAYCNVCKETFEHPHEGWTSFLNQDYMLNSMSDNCWHIDNDNCYCPKCHEVDDEDNVIINHLTP